MPSSPSPTEPYPSLARFWKARHGGVVRRVVLDAGLSCPNRDGTVGRGGCTFCDPASFSPRVGDPRPVEVQLREGIERWRRRGVEHVAAYFQPHTNTHAPVRRLAMLWDAPLPFSEVVALCVGTRPDAVPDPVLDALAQRTTRWEVWLELGLQSAHDRTLETIRRGHDAAVFASATRRARARGLQVCAHVILGLPGEGPPEERATARFLNDLGVEGVKLHQLAIVEGTPLAGSWRRGEIEALDEEAYVARAVGFLRELSPATVLHRLVGDTRTDRLLAPRFHKPRVIAAIRKGLGKT